MVGMGPSKSQKLCDMFGIGKILLEGKNVDKTSLRGHQRTSVLLLPRCKREPVLSHPSKLFSAVGGTQACRKQTTQQGHRQKHGNLPWVSKAQRKGRWPRGSVSFFTLMPLLLLIFEQFNVGCTIRLREKACVFVTESLFSVSSEPKQEQDQDLE